MLSFDVGDPKCPYWGAARREMEGGMTMGAAGLLRGI